MLIEGIRKLTLIDYPGEVACTLFTHGCNLRCPFCHNPSLVLGQPENRIKTDDIADFLKKRKGVLDGVCISGGEPLLQSDIIDFLRYIRGFGYKIKLDTNGFFPEKLAEIISLGLADYIAMDIKSSKENYSSAVGLTDIDVTPVIKSVDILKNSGIDYEFRTTAVKGIHRIEDFYEIGKWLGGAEQYYIQPFTDSGNLISANRFSRFSAEELNAFLSAVSEIIPNAEIRGI